MTVHTELLYQLVSADRGLLIAEAETIEAILLAVQTIAEDGEDVSNFLVMKGGRYDGVATAMAQEGWT